MAAQHAVSLFSVLRADYATCGPASCTVQCVRSSPYAGRCVPPLNGKFATLVVEARLGVVFFLSLLCSGLALGARLACEILLRVVYPDFVF